jgi:hypothetical protein
METALSRGRATQGRIQHSAIYDPIDDRMIIYGASHGAGISQPTWELSFDPLEWMPLAPGPMPMRGEHSALFDPVRNRMLVFGGDDGPHPHEKDTWSLAMTGAPTWNELYPTGTLPRSRWGHSAIYDPIRDRLVMHGGVDEFNVNFADQWSMSLDGPPQWSRLLPVGTKPQARREHTAIYDPDRDRMIIFGGRDDTLARLNDTWALNWNETPTDVRDDAVEPLNPSATLFQNTPNPFNPTTVIRYQLHHVAEVRLDIFDVHGRLVRNLVRRKQAPQTYSVEWDGNNDAGRRTPSGTYFYQLVVDNVRESRKMVVLK